MEFCRSGWPAKKALPVDVKPYHSISSEPSIEHVQGLLLQGRRIVVPLPLQETLLHKLHSSHHGITKCRELAHQSIWWPGLLKQLEELLHNCQECLKAQRQCSQPLTPTPLPDLPWQNVAINLFKWKQTTYLLVIDYFSRYIEIA